MPFGGVIAPGTNELEAFNYLLAIISDPDAAKKRLEELKAATAEYARKGAEAETALAANRQAQNEAVARLKQVSESSEQLRQEKNKLLYRERDVNHRENLVSQREREHDQHVNETVALLGERERAVGKREQDVSARESTVDGKEKALAFAKKEHEVRVAKLREAIG